MKIGIDVSQVVYGTGVSRYTSNLVKHLLQIDQENQYVLFGGSLRRIDDLRLYFDTIKAKNVKKVIAPISPAMADFTWNRIHRFKIEKLIGDIDIFHSSDWSEPPTRAIKVTTVHDLAPIKFPELTPKNIVDVHTQKLEWARKESAKVIAVSEATKRDLLEMGFDKNKIVVIPEAADEQFKPASKEEIAKVKRKYTISKRYLLGVGVNKRKNIQRTIDAYRELRKDMDIEFLIVGHPGEEILKQVQDDLMIHFTGHVPDSDMPVLYSGAEALVYPSLYEGFGLPILESFACKNPVVTSNVGSMKEIGENAAVLVDPESVEAIVKGVKKVLENRNEYVLKGMQRVKGYSWRKTAEKTLQVYKETVQN